MGIRYYLEGGGTLGGVTNDAFPKLVEVGGVVLPESFTAEVDAVDLPGVVTVRVRVHPKRGPVVEEITLTARSGRSVRPEDLYQVPLVTVRDEVMARAPTYRYLRNQQGEVVGAAERRPGTAAAAVRAELRRHGYQRIDDAHLREVADVYQAASRHPTKAVADRFGVPRPTAARWVMTARQQGFLAPAERRPAASREDEGGRG
jgi:hypothetical protein